MADFNLYFPIEQKLEGVVYENDAVDVGGCTKVGLTLDDLKKYYNNPNLTCDAVKNMTIDEAGIILKKLYWDYYRADEIPNQSLAMFLVDSRLNQGNVITKYIQQIVSVTDDGLFGNNTFNAMMAFDGKELYKQLYNKRLVRYNNIVASNPVQNKFYKGWINRLDAIKFQA
jgi:lysozyme family protein